MLDEVKEEFHGYDMAPVTRENFSQVFPVYASNQDFFLLTQGKKATIENSINDIKALPPHCKKEQKHYISIKKNGSVIGVCDFIETYPEQTSFWIGLLLIHRDLHNQTIGSNLVSALLRAAKRKGYQSAQLGVIENHTKGLRFWQKQGFYPLKNKGTILVMERAIL